MEEVRPPAGGRMRRAFRWASWISGAAVLLALVLVVAHLGELQAFLRLLQAAEPSWPVLGALLQLSTYLSAAVVWQGSLRRAGAELPYGSLVRLSVTKLCADQALPSGGFSGGMLVVATLLHRGISKGIAMAVLLVGMVGYYAGYALLVAAALILLGRRHAVSLLIVAAAGLRAGRDRRAHGLVLAAHHLAARAARWCAGSLGPKP
jgi:uncharacterized membrane protein YbhN (UPF0104 family)